MLPEIAKCNDQGIALLDTMFVAKDEQGTHFEGKILPIAMLASSAGLVFLDSVKVGAGIAFTTGHGFVIAKKPGGGWSPPVFLKTKGLQAGAVLGAETVQTLMVALTQAAILQLVAEGQRTFGTDISFKMIESGVSDTLDLNRWGSEWAVANFGKGVLFDFSLNGAHLEVDQDRFNATYGKNITPADVLIGKEPHHDELNPLLEKMRIIARQVV